MIRLFDFFFSLIGILLLIPIYLLVSIVTFFDTGSPIFIQKRMGINKQPFNLYKFRTMQLDTKQAASHLVDISSITKIGLVLRRIKLDELPQLFNVLIGDMSMVGPRPNLFNQEELIQYRTNFDVYSIKPGITGLAQISNIDMSTPELLATYDQKMLNNLNLRSYFYYIFKTISGSGKGDAVK